MTATARGIPAADEPDREARRINEGTAPARATATATSTATPTATALTPAATTGTATVVAGAVAGLAGGVTFAAATATAGMLPTIASIVLTDSALVGLVLHLVIAAAIGVGFALVTRRQRAELRDVLLWGLVYGGFWWLLGALTLLPLARGMGVTWDLVGAQTAFASLIGHLAYGATVAAVLVALRRRHTWSRPPRVATLARGTGAGLLAAGAVAAVGATSVGVPTSWLVVVGAAGGFAYPLIFGSTREAAGPALVRGGVYGFLLWLAVDLTILPLAGAGPLDWSVAAARDTITRLPAAILLGGAIAVLFVVLGALGRFLFSDDVREARHGSPGGRALLALGIGVMAGLVGGLMFTAVVMVVGGLSVISGLVGADDPVSGLVVHLVVAQLIGIGYAVLFARTSFDVSSGIGWGLSYGVLWWFLGSLTLLPVLSGGQPAWSVDGLTTAYPLLVAHVAYGAALGVVHCRLQERADPSWFSRSKAESTVRARAREQVEGSAPALWGLTLAVALMVPVLVAG